MEMIAMLGGLGAGPYIEKPSEKAVGVIAAINGAKKVSEIDAILNGLPVMGLPANELAVLQAAAIAKREQILTPFYMKGSYWLLIGGLAAAWVFRDRIKSLFSRGSLSGLSAAPGSNKIKLRLSAGEYQLVDRSSEEVMKAAQMGGSKVSIRPLPSEVNPATGERTHQRIVTIENPTSETLKILRKLDLSPLVSLQIKG